MAYAIYFLKLVFFKNLPNWFWEKKVFNLNVTFGSVLNLKTPAKWKPHMHGKLCWVVLVQPWPLTPDLRCGWRGFGEQVVFTWSVHLRPGNKHQMHSVIFFLQDVYSLYLNLKTYLNWVKRYNIYINLSYLEILCFNWGFVRTLCDWVWKKTAPVYILFMTFEIK